MRIAVINETSAGDKNKDILKALEGFHHEILNVGMKAAGTDPELTYIHTGFLGALFLQTQRADLVVGGCGTGIGFLNSIMQYPNVFCGLLREPLDAWLFAQINAGNAISLALNQGYGWAGEIQLRFLFERLFSVQPGSGYPKHRAQSQSQSRTALETLSQRTHRPFLEIVQTLPEFVIRPALEFPGVLEALDPYSLEDKALAQALFIRSPGLEK